MNEAIIYFKYLYFDGYLEKSFNYLPLKYKTQLLYKNYFLLKYQIYKKKYWILVMYNLKFKLYVFLY